MNNNHISGIRMYNQYITNPQFKNPEEVVKNMVAMQAQDYAGAKWAVGLRMQNANDALIEQALTNGKILRTHLLRSTWHFVAADDIRWILKLTAPRTSAINAGMYKKFELDTAIFNKTTDVFIKALEGNKQLTRTELTEVLNQNNIPTDGLRFTLLLIHAELDGIICSGSRIGKQFTYALIDERAPYALSLNPEEALAKLALGYFNTRGPATVHDFAYWSGLTIASANTGLNNIKEKLISEIIDGKIYWRPDNAAVTLPKPKAYLLPAFDEFAIAYKEREALINPEYLAQARHVIFDPAIVVDDQVVGSWKRTVKTRDVDIAYKLYGKINKTQQKAIDTAASLFRKFLL
jgi:hypothetical protein